MVLIILPISIDTFSNACKRGFRIKPVLRWVSERGRARLCETAYSEEHALQHDRSPSEVRTFAMPQLHTVNKSGCTCRKVECEVILLSDKTAVYLQATHSVLWQGYVSCLCVLSFISCFMSRIMHQLAVNTFEHCITFMNITCFIPHNNKQVVSSP